MRHTSCIELRAAVSAAAGACLLIFFLAGCSNSDDSDPTAADTLSADTTAAAGDSIGQESIYDILLGDGRFSTFVTAIDSADLSQTLSGPGPFTVFAPVNEAFGQTETDIQDLLADENESDLRDLVLGHMANGEKESSALAGEPVRTLAGGDLDISGSGDSLRVGEAQILESDLAASNGVIHAVSDVLAPSMDDQGR